MRLKNLLFFVIVLFFVAHTANAQLSSLGLDRSIGGSGQFQQSKNKDNKKEFDFVQASTDKMVRDLSLDDFQKAAVKNFIQDYKDAVVSINTQEIPDEGKYEKMNKEKDKMESKILSLLNKDQVKKFEALKAKAAKKGNSKNKSEEKEEKE